MYLVVIKLEEAELRPHRCCFTGHRPEKLGMPSAIAIKGLRYEIEKAISAGYVTFITGMSRGVDIWAGEIVLDFRDSGVPIRLICASPYPGFERQWPIEWRQRYQTIMEKADLVRFISPGYHAGCFQKRNEWMVDHAAKVIAVYRGQSGGTRNTVEYAYSQGVNVTIVNAIS